MAAHSPHFNADAANIFQLHPDRSGGGNSGEPPDNGGMELNERVIRMEEKVSAVDARLGLVEKDVRDLGKKMDTHFYWVLAAFVGLAGLMAKGFHWL